MLLARHALLFLLAAFARVSTPHAQSSPSAPSANTVAGVADLTRERALIGESIAARNASDYGTARAKAAGAVTSLLARPAAEQDVAWLALLEAAGRSAWQAEDARTADTAWRRVFADRSRTLPDDHPDLQWARGNLALALMAQGDLAGARDLSEKVLDVYSHALGDDHPDLQKARQNLAAILFQQGDLARARLLFEKVLEVYARTLPDEHLELQRARGNLGSVLRQLGDHAGARALFEKVLEVESRTLPAEHPELQRARGNVAATLRDLGDLQGARDLQEIVLELQARVLPEDHPDLQLARANLAATLYQLHDLEGARELFEKVLEIESRTMPDDHPDLQRARENLAVTLYLLGDLSGARMLEEKVLEVRTRRLPDDHPQLQLVRSDLAATIAREAARSERISVAPAETTYARASGRARCADLIGAQCRAEVRAARAAILESPGREAEERCSSLAKGLDVSLSFANGLGVFEPSPALDTESFALSEMTRGAALASAALARRAASSSRYTELCGALRRATDELAGLAQTGTTSEHFDRARLKRESVERELVTLARELSGGKASVVELDVESLTSRLDVSGAAVSYRRFSKSRIEFAEGLDPSGQPAMRDAAVDSLCAFVVRKATHSATRDTSATLTAVDLGPIAPIESATREWRKAIGVGRERGMAAGDSSVDLAKTRGDDLRKLIFDPLLTAIGDAGHVVVVLDDVLHLVPLDALPLVDSEDLVGDRWRMETRATLTELLTDSPAPTGTALLALGGASFNALPVALSDADVASIDHAMPSRQAASDGNVATVSKDRPTRVAAVLRATAWERGFTPLTYTGDEARGIGALYTEIHGDERPVLVLEKSKASREALEEVASKARFVHIATHGWFATESIQSWSDPEPLDKQSGLGTRMSGVEQVKGMSPMLLCGLALAGANLPENAVGRAPGLITADELSTLDLSNCELAVLSACDTNVGERRAGQGVASLQKALQMAGARSVITSLWKVPDEATKELMLDFYRRLWVEKKPKHQALWEAKTKLREAKDASGAPMYTTRDWAAWVLTGDPD